MDQQNHPLYSTDRQSVDRFLAKDSPDDDDLVDLARLLVRYRGFPGAVDLQEDMVRVLDLWGLTQETLNACTKKLWEEGFRPGKNQKGDVVGSSFDTANQEGN